MMQHVLSFKFKGDRNYIQGPDIIDAVIELLQQQDFCKEKIKDFKYAAHKMLHTNALATIDKNQQVDAHSLISFNHDGEKYFVSLEPASSLVQGSSFYDETVVITNSVITDNKISMKYAELNGYSFSELIVSMNKYFLQKRITNEGKWIVSKVEYIDICSVSPAQGSMVSLVLIKNLNNKLTKSSIQVNERNVGSLYFSLI
jgi:hypothetical protein